MTTTTHTPPLTPRRLMLLLEDAHREGRVPDDTFRDLSESYDALYGDNGSLARARAAAASWESVVLEQAEHVRTGTGRADVLRDSSTCLQHALSELGRNESEATVLRRRLWQEWALAMARTPSRPEDAPTGPVLTDEEAAEEEAALLVREQYAC